MDQFKLSFELPVYSEKIEHGQTILFLGSCFSDEIASLAKMNGFEIDSNPFGTVFHPLALSRFIKETLAGEKLRERITKRNDLFFSWDASSQIFGFSEKELGVKLNVIRREYELKLKTADFLFVTFGTAWGYRNLELNTLVANCHKFPSIQFSKELSSQDMIIEEWKETIEFLKKINPKLSIYFTVSPVRHSKDGLIENNQSKAILLDSIRRLKQKCECGYFPSYEIVIDELRDYRFFKIDRVHPNEEAVQYVWSRFADSFFTVETNNLCKEVLKIKKEESHKSLFPMSDEAILHAEKLKEKKQDILRRNPDIMLD